MDKTKWGDPKGRPQWNPTDEEVARFEKMSEHELAQEVAKGGKWKEKVRRWWMKKNNCNDVYVYYRELQKWASYMYTEEKED